MERKIHIKVILGVVFLALYSISGYSQATGEGSIPFQPVFNQSIRGDLTIIGNNSVSVRTDRFAPEDDYNLITNNNGLFADYINVAPEPGIFSSSTARYERETECSEIIYAGLYWAASYNVGNNNGLQTQDDEFYRNPNGTPLPDNRPDFRGVKFKPPGATNYIDLRDDTPIFDGWAGSATNNDVNGRATKNVPYVCFSDVTTIVQGLANPEGDYTVANIRTFTGRTSIGTCAGWSLVIVYDDPNLTRKFISSFDGFAQIQSGDTTPEEYSFSGFNTIPTGPVRADFGTVALEGDISIPGDRLLIRANNAPTTGGFGGEGFTALSNGTNPAGNFFNSTVSENGMFVTQPQRNPGSQNTLGFDQDIFRIPNGGNANTRIGNNETGASFRLITTGDSYFTYLNTFTVEVIEPDINILKKVEDPSGQDITGGIIFLGETLYYKLTVQNVGNDNATNTVISDQLPINVNEDLSEITADDPRIIANYTFDPVTRRFTFPIPDDLVEVGDASFDITFRVDVVSSCEELRDACSTEVQNIAVVSYEGDISGIERVNDKPSFFEIDVCGRGTAGASNFFVNDDICATPRERILCGSTATLTGGDGYTTYEWTFPDGSVQNTQTITVSELGRYTLRATDVICRDIEELWDLVPLDPTGISPIEDEADRVVRCRINNERIPEIYLCGADDTVLIDSNDLTDVRSAEWERASCPDGYTNTTDYRRCALDVSDPGNPCVWNSVGTGATYNVAAELDGSGDLVASAAGDYRLLIEYENGCTQIFNFKVFQNILEPELTILEPIIFCDPDGDDPASAPGVITQLGVVEVTNIPNGYEYSLNEAGPFTTLDQYQVNLTDPTNTAEPITVYMRLINSQFPRSERCVFSASARVPVERPRITVTIPTEPTCPEGTGSTGSINVQVNDSGPVYEYTLIDVTNSITLPTVTINETNYLFEDLQPGDYRVEVVSYDDNCTQSDTVNIPEPPDFSGSAQLVKNLSCDRAEIEVRVNDGTGDFSFELDGVALSGEEINIPPPNPITPGFLPSVSDNGDGTYTVFVADPRPASAGMDTGYVITIVDNESGCRIDLTEVFVEPYTPTTFTATPTDVSCANAGDGRIVVSAVTGGVTPFIYSIVDSGGTTTASMQTSDRTYTFPNLSNGAYEVIVTDSSSGSCLVTDNVTIENKQPITGDIRISQELTCVDSATVVIENVAGGTGAYTYSIGTRVEPTGVFDNLSANVSGYTIRVTDANDCFAEFTSDPIEPNQEITAIMESMPSALTCPDLQSSITLTATITNDPSPVSGTAAGIEYRVVSPVYLGTDPRSGDNTFSTNDTYLLDPGVDYTFEARTQPDLCTFTYDTRITPLDPIAITPTLVNNVTCVDEPDGAFQFVVSNSANYTYSIVIDGTNTVIGTFDGTGAGLAPEQVTALPDGTYEIRVTDTATNCPQTNTFEITEPDTPLAIDSAPVVDATCVSLDSGRVTVDASGGSGGYRYQIVLNTPITTAVPVATAYQTSNEFLTVIAGTHTVFVTDLNGCEEPFEITVDSPENPTGTAAIGCHDATTGETTITVTMTAGTAPFSYELDGVLQAGSFATNTITIPGLVPDTYDITIIDANSCTVDIDGNTVAQPLGLDISPPTINCTPTLPETTYTLTGTNGYIGSGYNYFVSINGGSETAISSPYTTTDNGTFEFIVRDTNGCEFRREIPVTEITKPAVQIITPRNPNCAGLSNGAVNIVPNPALGLAPYTITVGSTVGAPGQTLFGSLADGTYNYTITDGNGCTFTDSFELMEPDPITAILTPIPVSCSNVTGAGNTLGSIDVTGINGGTGDYNLQLFNIDGTPVVLGTSPAYPLPTSNNRTVVNNTGPENTDFGAIDFGDYYIIISDENSCAVRFNVTVPPPAILDIGLSDISGGCVSGVTYTFSILGGSGSYETAEFIDGPRTPVPPLATTLVFTGRPFNIPFEFFIFDTVTGCSSFQEAPAAPSPSTLAVSATDRPELCVLDGSGGVEFEVTGGPASGTVSWEVFNQNDGSTTGNTGNLLLDALGEGSDIVSGLSPGEYFIRIDDSTPDFCPAAATFTVDPATPLDGPQLVDDTQPNCSNENAQIILTAAGGTGVYTYHAVLAPGVGTAPLPAVGDFTTVGNILTLAPNTDPTLSLAYDIFVKDSNDCIDPIPLRFTVDPYTTPAIDDLTFDQCDANGDGTFDVTVTATGNDPIDYIYDGVVFGNDIASGTPYTFMNIPAGSRTFTVRDALGCTTDTMMINLIEPLAVSLVLTTLPECTDGNGVLTATVTGGTQVPANITLTLVDDSTGPTGVTGTLVAASSPLQYTFRGADGSTEIEPGNYTITVTDTGVANTSALCDPTDTEVIPAPAPIGLEAITPPLLVSCIGATDGTIEVELNPATTDPTVSYTLSGTEIRAAQASPIFENLGIGTYTVTARSGRGCEASVTTNITNPPALSATAAPTEFACDMDNADVAARITVTVDGSSSIGTPPYTFSLDGGVFEAANGPDEMPIALAANQHVFRIAPFAGVTPQTFNIIVKDSKDCEFLLSQDIQPLLKPVATVTPTTALDCINGGEVVEIEFNQGTGPFSVDLLPEGVGVPTDQDPLEDQKTGGALGGGAGNITYTLSVAGNYTFRIIDTSTGCYIDKPYRVDPLPDFDVVGTKTEDVRCLGDSNGALEFVINGGYTGTYTYTLINNDSGVAVRTNVPSTVTPPAAEPVIGLPAGNYTIEVTQTASPFCTSEPSNLVILPPPPSDLTLEGLLQVPLSCRVDENGMPILGTIEAIARGGQGGYEYQLETLDGALLIVVIRPYGPNPRFDGLADLPAGTSYVLRVRDSRGCVETFTAPEFELTLPPDPTASAPPGAVMLECFDDKNGMRTITASGGQPPYNFIISRDGTEDAPRTVSVAPFEYTFNALEFGVAYTGRVVDDLGCEDTFVITVDQPTEIEIGITESGAFNCGTPISYTFTPTGGTGLYDFELLRYSLTDPIAAPTASTVATGATSYTLTLNDEMDSGVTDAGSYVINVTDANSCEATPTNGIPLVPIPELDLSLLEIIPGDGFALCAGDNNATVIGRTTGGQGDVTYQLIWVSPVTGQTTPPGLSPGFIYTEASPDYTDPGAYSNLYAGNYRFVVTDNNGCGTDFEEFTLEEPLAIEATITSTNITCFEADNGTITIVATGGTGELQYTIDDGVSDFSRRTQSGDDNVFVELEGGTYTVTITDENGCVYYDDPIAQTLPEVIIIEPLKLEAEIDPARIVGETCQGLEDGSAVLVIRGGTPPYFVSRTDEPGSYVDVSAIGTTLTNDDFEILYQNLAGGFQPFFVTDSQDCPLEPVAVEIPRGLSATAELEVTCSGVDENIMASFDILVTIPANVPDNRKDDLTYFLTDISVSPMTTITSRNPLFENLGPGTYELSVRNGDGTQCTFVVPDTIEVADYEPVVITAVVPTGVLNEWKVIVAGGVPFDTSTGGNPYNIYVNLDPGTPVTEQLLPGNTFIIDVTRPYSIRVEDSLNNAANDVCPFETILELEFVDLFIPNYFTPNGDGTYDTWYPENTEFFPDIKVKVFDRYGRLLEQFKGPVKGWDGRYQDKLLPSGDYWYLIELNEGGRERQFTGHFTLYR